MSPSHVADLLQQFLKLKICTNYLNGIVLAPIMWISANPIQVNGSRKSSCNNSAYYRPKFSAHDASLFWNITIIIPQEKV